MKEHRSAAPVLVGVDGSPGSWAAVELGAWEAKRRRVPLHLVNGYSGETPYLTYGLATAGSLVQSRRDHARALVSDIELETRATHPGLSVHGTVVAGGGASGLVELSRDASLVVVGSRGHGGFFDLLIGSVAAQVAMHAHAPVIVVRPPTASRADTAAGTRLRPGSGPVVVGFDGSAGSDIALRFAAEEAVARACPLVVAHVWSPGPEDALRPDPAGSANAEVAASRVIAEVVEPWRAKYPDLEIEPRPIGHLNPAWSLVETSTAACLLVVGTRGRGGFAGLLLGSVSRGVASHAHCPVAIVRDPS